MKQRHYGWWDNTDEDKEEIQSLVDSINKWRAEHQ